MDANLEALAVSAAQNAPSRPLYVRDVPKTTDAKVSAIGMVKLTPIEEREALDLAGTSRGAAIQQQVIRSLRMVEWRGPDGQLGARAKLTFGMAGESDPSVAFAKMDPKLRNMIAAFYIHLHTSS